MRRRALLGLVPAVLLAAAPAALAGAPRAPVVGCKDRITGAVTVVGGESRPYRFVVRPGDTVIGPVAFAGARRYGAESAWSLLVARDQWLKTLATLRHGARATLAVPRGQRAWMRLTYGGVEGPAVTLRACRGEATREECGRGPRDTCHGRTPWAGGFVIDYAKAPHQGRCAELEVWLPRRERPLRERLFAATCE
ncbi:MAG: hypothetical protein HZB46_13165 [Solirubrobacterales bacterium]|nr:hypothetical protein [Solirubrobacterales bacterium]